MAKTRHVLIRKGSNVRNLKCILIACLAVLQLALVVQSAVAASMAHGRFNGLNAPEFSIPGQRLDFSATAVNDGDSAGWFRICVIKVYPPLTKYFPSEFNQAYDDQAVHCSEVSQIDPGGTITFESYKFRMLSVPSVTFWILLAVQQQAPIPNNEDGSDFINLTIDELREVVITNLYP